MRINIKDRPGNLEFNKRIGVLLNNLRIKGGYSTQDMAAMVNVSYQQYNKYEKGENSPNTYQLQLLAEFFEVSVMYFFGNEEVKSTGLGVKYANIVDNLSKINDPRVTDTVVALTWALRNIILKDKDND